MPIWGFPGTGASGHAVSDFVTSHHAGLVIGMTLNIIGVSLWLALGAGVWGRLRASGDQHGDRLSATAACFALGYTAFVTLLLAGFLFFAILVTQREPDNARLLYDMTFGLLATPGAPTAPCLTAFAVRPLTSSAITPVLSVRRMGKSCSKSPVS